MYQYTSDTCAMLRQVALDAREFAEEITDDDFDGRMYTLAVWLSACAEVFEAIATELEFSNNAPDDDTIGKN